MDITFQQHLHVLLREQHILQHKELVVIVTMRMLLLMLQLLKSVEMELTKIVQVPTWLVWFQDVQTTQLVITTPVQLFQMDLVPTLQHGT